MRRGEKSRLLHDRHPAVNVPPGGKRVGIESPPERPVGVHDKAVSADDIGSRARAKGVDGLADRARQVGVVCVNISEDVAGGPGKALVQTVGGPRVGLEDGDGNPVAVALDDVPAPIGRARVDDDIFDIVVVVLDDRKDSAFEKGRLIEGDRDDGDLHEVSAAGTPRRPAARADSIANMATTV